MTAAEYQAERDDLARELAEISEALAAFGAVITRGAAGIIQLLSRLEAVGLREAALRGVERLEREP